jgi:hypothetical protein
LSVSGCLTDPKFENDSMAMRGSTPIVRAMRDAE